jgi:hypothetical protein
MLKIMFIGVRKRNLSGVGKKLKMFYSCRDCVAKIR